MKNLSQNIFSQLGLFLVGIYRTIGTTHMGGACRFHPSCSEYAVEAYKSKDFLAASQLIVKRIFKCRPGGSFGYDPVPEGKVNGR